MLPIEETAYYMPYVAFIANLCPFYKLEVSLRNPLHLYQQVGFLISSSW
jgi:hypothetical protein